MRDGDPIRAVIKGTRGEQRRRAEGRLHGAQSVEGQAAVIREALEVADVDPSTIRYVEGHGSGTELGDPIEIAALTQAWRRWTDRRQFAAVGSREDATSATWTRRRASPASSRPCWRWRARALPPTVHFRAPNPRIDFAALARSTSPARRRRGTRGRTRPGARA